MISLLHTLKIIFLKLRFYVKKFKERRDSRYIYQNELEKACFQHDMVYRDFTNLPRRTASEKILWDTAFNIAENPKYDGCQRSLTSMVYTCFDKKSYSANVSVKSKTLLNQQLAE